MKTHAIKLLKRLAAAVLFAPVLAMASTAMHLDKAPVSTDQQKLQRGAELFIKYCLNCHSASMVRYSELKKLGFDEKKITEELIYSGGKIGDLMTIAMTRDDAEAWFGTAPPDLSLMARAKGSEFGSGADYLYTYLRGFYKDENRPTGWNNKVFDNVGMPHALWDLQGEQPAEKYDEDVADLVSFMVWMGEPDSGSRKKIGIFVIIFLAGFYVLTHKLGKTYWKNTH
ncbi:MAG: cytochrome c1 [Betaproteobacteria bacterium]|jgi:ubiquinol-cytochrome c reductase cytochrome c1 subunit|nr:cytochrome c1 [Betaproteobacteria bacterium]